MRLGLERGSGTSGPTDGAALAGKLVLLAEADADSREIVTLVLEGEGALVTVVDGVLAARQRLLERPYDLAVIAADLPDGDGMDVVTFMHKSGVECAAVMIAREAGPDTGAALEQEGVADFVSKPLPGVDVLRRRLSHAAETHALGRQNRRLAAELRAKEELLTDLASRADVESRRVAALERSIASADFDFVYQPIVETKTWQRFAYEALCRPRDPAFPHPSALIRTAERCGCTAALGRALRQKGVQALNALPEGSLLFLNLHPQELLDPEFVAIEPFVAQWAGQVVFEITEVGKIGNFEYVREVIKKLRGSGFRVALDDLGAGYSGLTALARLAPDIVKLDMHLVQAAVHDPRTRRLLRHVVDFATGEGTLVVAEGIETEQQRDIMADLGCPLMQGFLFGRGLPLVDVLQPRAEMGAALARMRVCSR